MSEPGPRPPTAETRRSARRRRPCRTAVPACRANAGFRCDAASAGGAAQLRGASGLHLLEVVAGVIARPGQRRRSDEEEALGAGDRGVGIERLRSDELLDLRMLRRRLE